MNHNITMTVGRLQDRGKGVWRWLGIGAGVMLFLLVGTAVSLALSPIGQRYFAEQTTQPAVATTAVMVVGDEALNHLFSPAVIEVRVGDDVTWTFAEVDEAGMPVAHNVVFEDMASPVQAEGSYSRSFDTVGTYQYVCTLHPFMEGAVVVTE